MNDPCPHCYRHQCDCRRHRVTTGEVVDQINRAIEEAQAAWIFSQDLHPEVREEVGNRINAARAILQSEAARLVQMAKEVAE